MKWAFVLILLLTWVSWAAPSPSPTACTKAMRFDECWSIFDRLLGSGRRKEISLTTKERCLAGDSEFCGTYIGYGDERYLDFWADEFKRQAFSIEALPSRLVAMIEADERWNQSSARPVPAVPDAGWRRDLEGAWGEIPAWLRKRYAPFLRRIYLVRRATFSALVQEVLDDDGALKGSLFILNLDALDRSANAHASWKESTAFRLSPGQRIEARVATKGEDTRRTAIRLILLHELGHLISYEEGIFVPEILETPERLAKERQFFPLSWKLEKEKAVYREEADFPERKELRFYGSPEKAIDGSRAASTYRSLLKSSFPTLYAATHPADDFADSFANYVHVVIMKRPYHVSLVENGRKTLDFGSCWSEPRCAPKRAFFDRIRSLALP